MNSMAVGMTPPSVMIFGTAPMASPMELNRQSISTDAFGNGSSFKMIFVKTPRMPSEPIIS